MSDSFFKDLGIPEPKINLEIGSGSHAEQVGNTMIAFEKVLKEHKPDWVVVVGDQSSLLADFGIEIGTYARLGIKIPCVGDRPIIQYFVIAVAHTGAVGESFGFDPQTVPVCADPSFAVPAELIPSAVAAAFELIE